MGCGNSIALDVATRYVHIDVRPVEERYLLLDGCLGKGTFGTVHIGQELRSGTKYALKAVPRHSADDDEFDSIFDFQHNVEVLSGISHPRVVCLHDYFASRTHTYMVFPIFYGGCVREGMSTHWKERGEIPINAVRNVWRQMVEGVDYIHNKNIVHRDVKPDNFLMDVKEISSPHINIGLSDFDFAVRIRTHQHLVNRCGTTHYMAPELLIDKPRYGMKVDIWALGVTLNCLTTGEHLFENEAETLSKDVVAPQRLPSEAKRLFLATLDRNKDSRITASKIMEDEWLASDKVGTLSLPEHASAEDKESTLPSLEIVTAEEELPTILGSPKRRPRSAC